MCALHAGCIDDVSSEDLNEEFGCTRDNGQARGHSRMIGAKISSNRSSILLDSTSNMDTIFYGGFPLLFPLGQGLERMKTGFSRKFHLHLVSQFTNAFANNQHALFLMLNMHMKTISNTAASVRLKNRTDVADFFEKYVMNTQFIKKAKAASKNPHGKEAAEIQRVVFPFLKLTGAMVPFSEYEKQAFYHEVWSMAHRFGEPAYFVTLSPNHDAFTLRFGFPSLDRKSFPATTVLDHETNEDLNQVLQDPARDHIDLPGRAKHCSESCRSNCDNEATNESAGQNIDMEGNFLRFNTSNFNLTKFASENPVACAAMFKKIINEVLDILIGIPMSNSRKSKIHTKKGIVGLARAMAGCAEGQGRGALHMHLIVWSALDPQIVQYCAGCPALMARISRVIESHLFQSIPAEYHMTSYLQRKLVPEKKVQQPRYMAMDVLDIQESADSCVPSFEYTKRLCLFSTGVQVHSHTFTCHKGAIGEYLCRMARKQPCVAETRAVEFDISQRPPTNDVSKLHMDGTWTPKLKPAVTPMPLASRRNPALPVRARGVPALTTDPRVVKVDVIRPKVKLTLQKAKRHIEKFCADNDVDISKDFVNWDDRDECLEHMVKTVGTKNGYMVETNDVLSACTLAQSNVQWLDTAYNAKNAMRYLASYLSKSKVKLSTTFALMASVRKEILTSRVSSADDRRTPSRTSKHLLARMHNMSMKSTEIASTQCAQYLFGMPVFFSSERFQKCFVSTAYNHIVESRDSNKHYQELDLNGNGCANDTDTDEDQNDCQQQDMSDASELSDREDPLDCPLGKDTDHVNVPMHKGIGTCPTYSIAPQVMVDPATGTAHKHYVPDVPVAQHMNYGHRGECFTDFNLIEYVACVQQPTIDNQSDMDYKFIYQIPPSIYKSNTSATHSTREVDGHDDSTAQDGDNNAPTSDAQGIRPSRKSSARFVYDKDHPLMQAGFPHSQKLLSLQYTITLSGKQPPRLPAASTRNVNRKLDEFARYYLVLFKPWDDPTYGFSHALNWEAFVDFVNDLDQSTCVWHKGRLAMLQSMIGCQSLSKTIGTLLSAYRFREAQRWSDASDDESAGVGDSNHGFCGREHFDFYGADDDEFASAHMVQANERLEDVGRSLEKLRKKQECLRHHEMMLKEIHLRCQDDGPGIRRSRSRYRVRYVLPKNRTAKKIAMAVRCEEVLEKLKSVENTDPKSDTDDENAHVPACASPIDIDTDNGIPTTGPREPSEEQQRIIDDVMEAVKKRQELFADESGINDTKIEALPHGLFLMHGAAGTGKTNVVLNLDTMCTLVAVATTGNAATLIQKCTTVHKRHGFPFNVQRRNTFLPSSKTASQDLMEADVYLLDEMSMLNTNMISHISRHLQQVRSQDERLGHVYAKMPFGGLVVVLSGDFRQLPPVSEAPIYKSLFQQASKVTPFLEARTPMDDGVQLFKQFRMRALTVQQRLQKAGLHPEDPDHDERHAIHRRMIERFSTHTRPLDDDEVLEYLRSRQIADHEDFSTDRNTVCASAWKFAPHVVTNNAQRIAINYNQAIKWSEHHNVPMLWWETNVKGNAFNELAEEDRDHVFDSTPELKDCFVPMAPCYLTYQLSPEKGIANGTQGTLHSLVFINQHKKDTDEHAEMEDLIASQNTAIRNAIPGRPLKLFLRPTYVNVAVKNKHGEKWAFATLPSDDEQIGIIPFKVSEKTVIKDAPETNNDKEPAHMSNDKRVQIPGFHSQGDETAYVSPTEVIPISSIKYELGFATTVHKSQGQTMGKIIVDLNDNPFLNPTLAMIYVILTRVRNGDDIRLMPFRKPDPQWKARLRNLTFPPELQALLSAYGENGVLDESLILDYMKSHGQKPAKAKSSMTLHPRTTSSNFHIRQIPDPMQNISFVNSVMHALLPVYTTHISTWHAFNTSKHFEPFHSFMTALSLSPHRGHPKVSLETQQRFYGKLQDHWFTYISEILPRHKTCVEGAPTPTPSDFFDAFTKELGWTCDDTTQCSSCKAHAFTRAPMVANMTIQVDQINCSNASDVLAHLRTRTACTQCAGVHTDTWQDKGAWDTVELLTIRMHRAFTNSPCEILDHVTLCDTTFDLVSIIRKPQTKNKRHRRLNKNLEYDACVKHLNVSASENESTWTFSVLNQTHGLHSEMPADVRLDACMLLYVRRGSAVSERNQVEVGDYVCFKNNEGSASSSSKTGLVRSCYHEDSFEILFCDETTEIVGRRRVLHGKREFFRLTDGSCICGSSTCINTIRPAVTVGNEGVKELPLHHVMENVTIGTNNTGANHRSGTTGRASKASKERKTLKRFSDKHSDIPASKRPQITHAATNSADQEIQAEFNTILELAQIRFTLSCVIERAGNDLQTFQRARALRHQLERSQVLASSLTFREMSNTLFEIIARIDQRHRIPFYGSTLFLEDVISLSQNRLLCGDHVNGLVYSTRSHNMHITEEEKVHIQNDNEDRPLFCLYFSLYRITFDLQAKLSNTLPELIQKECTMGLIINHTNTHWYLVVLTFRNNSTPVTVKVRDSHLTHCTVNDHKRQVRTIFETIHRTYEDLQMNTPYWITEQIAHPTFEVGRRRPQTESECGIEVANHWADVLIENEIQPVHSNWTRDTFTECIRNASPIFNLVMDSAA